MEQKTNNDLLSFKAQLKFRKLASSGNYWIKNLFLQQMKIQQKFGDKKIGKARTRAGLSKGSKGNKVGYNARTVGRSPRPRLALAL